MIQLILGDIQLPESQKGGYRAWEEDLSVDVEMISGRLVMESRGVIWKISYQYGWLNDDDRARVLTAIRKGRKYPIVCTFLPPESDELITSNFCVTRSSEPKFMWSSSGKPLWGDFSFELREERPHWFKRGETHNSERGRGHDSDKRGIPRGYCRLPAIHGAVRHCGYLRS